MEDNENRPVNEPKTIFDTVSLKTDEIRAAAEAASADRELEIFGEGEGALAKDGGVRYVKPKSVYVIIAGLVGALVGLIGTLIAVGVVTGGLRNLFLIRDMGKYDTSVITELLADIDTYHFGETPETPELVDKAAHALVNAMGDPYASYFTKKEYEDYYSSFSGNYYGIGVTIGAPDGTGALIHRVYEGSFAEAAGLKSGDLVTEVAGQDVRNVSSDELVSLIKGDEGTSVEMKVLRDGEEMTFNVERGEVYIKRVDRFMLDGDIGYLLLTSFSGNAVQEFREALDFFNAEGAKGIIVDLRDDPGGSLSIVVDICDMLLPKGTTICSMQGKTTDPTLYYTAKTDGIDLPLAVIVNGYSASASEIFAGAMQDNGRGVIVGTQTYGKGVVQTTFPLSGDKGYIKLTTDAYYTPNGTNLGGTGITPDEVVELTDGYDGYDIYTLITEYREFDTQLAKAAEIVSK